MLILRSKTPIQNRANKRPHKRAHVDSEKELVSGSSPEGPLVPQSRTLSADKLFLYPFAWWF